MTDATYTQRVTEAMSSIFGLSDRAAEVAARGRGGKPSDPFDAAVASFRSLGLSESAARTAAVGRMSESEARGFWSSGSSAEPDRFDRVTRALEEAKRTLGAMSDAECDAMWRDEQRRVEEQRRLRVRNQRPTARPKNSVSSGSRATTIQESGR